MQTNQGPEHGFSFTPEQVKRVLGSAEGKRLLQLLNADGGTALRQAAAAVKGGDYDTAKKIMEPLVQTGEAAELIDRINRK